MARQADVLHHIQEATVKGWLLSCCQKMSEKLSIILPEQKQVNERSVFRENRKQLANLVITPSNIPSFTIPNLYGEPVPEANNTQCEDILFSENGSLNSLETASQQSSSPGTPKLIMNGRPPSWRLYQSDPSIPVNPNRSPIQTSKRSHAISYDMIDEIPEGTTNADPRSRAAMSLPHLKTTTAFGFETLTECPKTKRKESLFHTGLFGIGKNGKRGKISHVNKLGQINKGCASEETRSPLSNRPSGSEHQRRSRSKRRNVTSMVKPLGVTLSPQDSIASTDFTSQSSLSHSTTCSFDQCSVLSESDEMCHPSLAERRSRFLNRRPASINQEDLPSVLNKVEDSSVTRQSYGDACLRQEELMQLWRISAMTNTSGVKNYPPVASEMSPLQTVVIPKSEYNGELKFKVSYDADRSELCVHLLEGINLGGSNRGPDPVNSLIKLGLHPSGRQRYTSKMVRQNNDPVFDQMFTFSDITREDMRHGRLSMELLNRERLRRKNELLGVVTLDLANLDFDIVTCHELIREVDTEQIPQELGRLQLQICFHAKDQKLIITLLQTKDLQRNPITGAPDTYINLELRQPGRPDVCYQSKVLKKMTAGTYQEQFSFDISPKIEDLNYTCLSLTVYEREVILSDRIIGEVRLGFGATEESEFEHWNKVLNMPGKEYTMWHMIMEEE